MNVVLWRVTERCDLACPFCASDRTLPGPRRDADGDGVLALARRLHLWGPGALLCWHGGEPLLWEPLLDVSRALARLGFSLSATTNGTRLGSERVRRGIVESFTSLTVSVDGVGPLHDRIRSWPGGYASLAANVPRLVEEARQAQRPLVLRANVVLLRDTVEGFGDLCRELATWGIREVTFNALGGRERPEYHTDHHLLPPQVEALARHLPALRRDLAPRGLRILGGERYLERLRATAEGRSLPVQTCEVARRFLTVDVEGRLAPCAFVPAGWLIPQLERPGCEDCPSTQMFDKFSEA